MTERAREQPTRAGRAPAGRRAGSSAGSGSSGRPRPSRDRIAVDRTARAARRRSRLVPRRRRARARPGGPGGAFPWKARRSATVPGHGFAATPARSSASARVAGDARSSGQAASSCSESAFGGRSCSSCSLTAFGSGLAARHDAAAGVGTASCPGGQPQPQIVATAGPLHICSCPSRRARVTAIGYHRAGDGALTSSRSAARATRACSRGSGTGSPARCEHGLVWYQLGGSARPGHVGARRRRRRRAPTSTRRSTAPSSGSRTTSLVEPRLRRPDRHPAVSAPSLVVSLTQLRPDPALTVGSAVAAAGARRSASSLDLSAVEHQALARYTQDAGNNVSLEVHPAATLSLR